MRHDAGLSQHVLATSCSINLWRISHAELGMLELSRAEQEAIRRALAEAINKKTKRFRKLVGAAWRISPGVYSAERSLRRSTVRRSTPRIARSARSDRVRRIEIKWVCRRDMEREGNSPTGSSSRQRPGADLEKRRRAGRKSLLALSGQQAPRSPTPARPGPNRNGPG